MNVTYDDKSDEWLVELTKEELDFLKTMANTYGDAVAQLCYPDDVTDIEE